MLDIYHVNVLHTHLFAQVLHVFSCDVNTVLVTFILTFSGVGRCHPCCHRPSSHKVSRDTLSPGTRSTFAARMLRFLHYRRNAR